MQGGKPSCLTSETAPAPRWGRAATPLALKIEIWLASSKTNGMKSVPLYEAKNRLSALIDEVEATGEDILITRHGKPAARLARARALPCPEQVRAAFA